MIGAEPPQLQHKAVKAGAVVLAVKGLSLPKLDQFGTHAGATSPSRCAPARSSASPASRATASRS